MLLDSRTKLGVYTPVKKLGEGLFGVSHLVRQQRQRQKKVLKLLHPLDGDPAEVSDERLRRLEADLARYDLQHPNLALPSHAGRVTLENRHATGVLYTVSDYVEGPDLYRFTARAAWSTILEVVVSLLRGLEALHCRGLLHGHLVTSNVIVSGQGPRKSARLLDPGYAEEIFASRRLGHHASWAPEVLRGEPHDRRADLYDLGCLLFECATRARVFGAEDYEALREAHLTQEPPKVRQLKRSVPVAVEAMIDALLRKDPRERPASANAVIRELNKTASKRFSLEAREVRLAQPLVPPQVRSEEAAQIAQWIGATCAEQRGERVEAAWVVIAPSGQGRTHLLRDVQARCPVRWVAPRAPTLEGLLAALCERGVPAVVQGQAPFLGRHLPAEVRAEGPPPAPVLDPTAERQRVVEAASRVLLDVARREPMVVVLDSGRFADPLLLDTLRLAALDLHQARAAKPEPEDALDEPAPDGSAETYFDSPLGMLLSVSTDELHGQPGGAAAMRRLLGTAGVRRLDLPGLSSDALERIVAGALGRVPDEVAELSQRLARVARRPGHALEVLGELSDRDLVPPPDGAWTLGEEALELVERATEWSETVGRRLTTLGLREPLAPSALRLIALLGCEGRETPLSLLVRALQTDAENVLGMLRELERRRWIEPIRPDRGLCCGLSLSDAILESVPAADLPALHAQLGRAAASLAEARGGEQGAWGTLAALHLLQSANPEQAVPHALRAARDAIRRSNPELALRLLERGVDWSQIDGNDALPVPGVDALHPEVAWHQLHAEASLARSRPAAAASAAGKALQAARRHRLPRDVAASLLLLAEAQARQGDAQAARTTATEAGEVAQGTGWRRGCAEALRLRAQAEARLGDRGQAEASLEEARTLFSELGDHAAQADALRWRARLRLSAGDTSGALSLAEQALDLDEDGDCLSRLATTLRLKTRVLREQGELEKAQQLTRRSIRSAEDALDLSEVARGLVAGADLLSVAGDVRAGRAKLQSALAVWERVGNEAGVAETQVRLGRAYLTTGELRAAEEQLAQASQGFKPMADRSRTAEVNASLAWTWLLRGDLAQAREHVDRALEDAQSAGTPGPRLEAQRVQAELYLAQGDLAGALELARRTAEEATRAALGRTEGRARLVIGAVLLAQGNSVEAERELREAFDLAEECGEGSLAARARLGIARVHLLRGEPSGTLGEVEKARDVAQSHEDAALEVQSLLALARLHLFLGQSKRAANLAEMARDRSSELDMRLYHPEATLLRGAALLQRVLSGDDDQLLQTAEGLLDEAEREATARRGLQAEINVVRARLELARGSVGAARERAESALEASRITDDRLTGIRAELALSRVRRSQGRLEEAKTAADHALAGAEAARDSEARARALAERGATYVAMKALALAGHDLRDAASEIRGVWASLPEDLREDYQSRPLVKEVSRTAAELAELLERNMPAESEASAPAAPPLPPTATPSTPDVTPDAQAGQGVQLESLRDPLTNLFNHTFFTAQLETEIKRAMRHSRPLALLKVNVDRFKLVRELYGAKTGKRVIQEVAQLLLRHVRDVDIVARYFGDEFEILLPDTEQRGALLTAERIREAVEGFRFEHDQERVELTLSMGVAVFPHDAKDRDSIICRADEALYHARSRGSNSVFSFGANDEDVLGESNAELRELDQLMLTREGRTILSMVQRLVNQELDIDHVIELVTGMVVEATRGERGFIMLKGGQDGEFRFRHGRNIDDKVINSPELKISNGIAKEVAETGRAIHVSEALEDGRFKDFKSVMDLNLRSILCAPIKQDDEVLGVIYVDHNQVARNFTQEDLNFLEAIADRVAIPLHNSKKLRETEDRLAMAEARLRSQSAQLQTKYAYDTIVGRSEEMQRVFKLLDRIVETTHSVVIHGESGTGKELIARAIHYNGPRKNKPFVAENCAALSETLLEAELFGHVKGAFTGADRDSKGLFELANGGTLFLDEIGDMSERMQKKLLRVLQEGEVRPVGGKRVFHVDVRIISASNKDLKKLVQERKFREDLYYRLNVITVNLPPLRERNEDVVLLVEHFLAQHAEAGSPRRLDRETMQFLISYEWPGNVRELENEVNRLVAMSDDVASPDLLSPKIREGSKTVTKETEGLTRYIGRPLKDAEYEFMRELITHTLDQTNWHRTKAAKLLKVPTSTLFNKMKKYGIG